MSDRVTCATCKGNRDISEGDPCKVCKRWVCFYGCECRHEPSAMRIESATIHGSAIGYVSLESPYNPSIVTKAKSIGGTWHPKHRRWVWPETVGYRVVEAFPEASVAPEVMALSGKWAEQRKIRGE